MAVSEFNLDPGWPTGWGARRRPGRRDVAVRAGNEAFRAHSAGDWLEGLVKAYVGDGIATDITGRSARSRPRRPRDRGRRARRQRALSFRGRGRARRDRATRVSPAPGAVGAGAWSVRRSAWTCVFAAERDALATLLVGGVDRHGADLAEFGRMLARLTERTPRMASLGLSTSLRRGPSLPSVTRRAAGCDPSFRPRPPQDHGHDDAEIQRSQSTPEVSSTPKARDPPAMKGAGDADQDRDGSPMGWLRAERRPRSR